MENKVIERSYKGMNYSYSEAVLKEMKEMGIDVDAEVQKVIDDLEEKGELK